MVFSSHDASNITNQDLVVYSAAIPQDNPELAEARSRGIPVMDRAELLGVIMDHFQHCIAVSGTHGKTTTTSMISQVMLKVDLIPLSMGGMLDAIGAIQE